MPDNSTPEVNATPDPSPARMQWSDAVELVQAHVVRIFTPGGSGTGFQFHRLADRFVVVATAAHVIDEAHAWEQPLRIVHATSRESVLLKPDKRAVFLDANRDTAAIAFPADAAEKLAFPRETPTLAPEKRFLKVGYQIGWLGFPSVAKGQLCFFGGRVSAWNSGHYLVDGVAINGVSGGPAFHIAGNGVILMGVLSAYIPNRATGEALPGLSVIRDVSHLHDLLQAFNSLEEAKAKETPPSETSTPPATDAQAPTPN